MAHGLSLGAIDVLNKDCRRSISASLTWVLENVKISARPLNSIGNERIFTLLLTLYLLPLAHTLLRVKCRYMSLVCINVTHKFFSRVVFFPAVFSAGQQTCLVAWTTSTPLQYLTPFATDLFNFHTLFSHGKMAFKQFVCLFGEPISFCFLE